MIIIFSVLMYPIFFIISYIFGEYIYPTKNGAMLFAFCCAFVLSYVYYTIRKRVRQLAQKKKDKKLSKEKALTSLMLVDEKIFKDNFKEKGTLADNSFIGINEEKILFFLRDNKEDIHIYSIKGVTDGAKVFLDMLKINYTIHSADEILEKTSHLAKPDIDISKETNKLKKLIEAITSKTFRKFSIKYGVILLSISIITPYKLYYILFGSLLIVYGIFLKTKSFISQRNRIPYPRS